MTNERQQRRADGLATVVAIALDELKRDDTIWPHTRELLASALAAYEAGKNEQPASTPEAVDHLLIGRAKKPAGEE